MKKVQLCKSAYGLCKGEKVNTKTGWGRTDYRLQSTDYGATPLPEAEPFPIRQTLTAIRLGQHAVLTLPFRNLIQLGDGGWGA